jgi:hypothetical protein
MSHLSRKLILLFSCHHSYNKGDSTSPKNSGLRAQPALDDKNNSNLYLNPKKGFVQQSVDGCPGYPDILNAEQFNLTFEHPKFIENNYLTLKKQSL